MSNQIRAFVGHSFLEKDELLNQKFLKYLNQLRDMNIGFSWEHAEKAEPIELSEKVRKIMADKNLFIGICTSNEVAIRPDYLKTSGLSKRFVRTDRTLLSFKTSDWIIQEIGFALGRDLELILLIENGIRLPGGLQGNIEYITFERDVPEKSFGKILEMIKSLMPKAKDILTEEPKSITAKKDQEEPKGDVEKLITPQPDWELRNYKLALMIAIEDVKDEIVIEKIKDAFLSSSCAEEPKNKEYFEAFEEYVRLDFGKGGKLVNLEKVAKKYEKNINVQRLLAIAYERFDDHTRAAEIFESAAQSAESEEDRAHLLGSALLSYVRSEDTKSINASIEKVKIAYASVPNGEVGLLNLLRSVAEKNKDDELYLGLMERLLQITPDDMDLRFRLAYKYGEMNESEQSLWHYLKIREDKRGQYEWNNLGAEYDNCNLPAKSTDAYRKAEELNNTLAMSNLANKFIKGGFLKEAEALCKHALSFENCHKNVLSSLSDIQNIPEKEDKKSKAILDKVRPIIDFRRQYGHASLLKNPDDFAGKWQGPKCTLELNMTGGHLVANGSYEVNTENYLASYLSGLNPAKSQSRVYHITYEGTMYGYAVKGTLVEKGDESSIRGQTLLTALGEAAKTPVLMFLSESLKEITVYERDGGKELKFYKLTRIA